MRLDQSSHLPSNRPPTTDNVGIGRAVARLEAVAEAKHRIDQLLARVK